MNRKIRILPSFVGASTSLICFETHVPSVEIREYTSVFEHHGSSYHPIFDAGALRMFYERLLLGQSFPDTLVLTRWWKIDQIMAASLFLTPSLVLSPESMSLVNTVDTVDRLGDIVLSHAPIEHKILIGALRMTAQERASDIDAYRLLMTCISLVCQYIERGVLPPTSNFSLDFDVVATSGAVVAFTSQEWAWDRAWQDGALCGVWCRPDGFLEIRTKSDLVTPALSSMNFPSLRFKDGAITGKADLSEVWEVLVSLF